MNGRRVQLAHLATFYRLPAIYGVRDFVEVGGLISYGADVIDSYRQAGRYVGRILKGAKPAELPIVKEDKFELVHQCADCPNARPHRAFVAAQPRR